MRLEEAYRLLGVPADSDLERVAEVYRRLARATHPDVSADRDASARFAALASAYHLVSAAARSGHVTGRQEDDVPPSSQTPTSESSESPQTSTPNPAETPTATSRSGFRSGARPLGEVSPYLRTGPGRRPIVAGPVSVRHLRDHDASGER